MTESTKGLVFLGGCLTALATWLVVLWRWWP